MESYNPSYSGDWGRVGSKKIKISLGNLVTVFLKVNRYEKAGRVGSAAEGYTVCLVGVEP